MKIVGYCSLLITIHLYLSSFFAAILVLMAFSGGMYLIGVKGSVEEITVGQISGGTALMADPSKDAVLAALPSAGIEDFSFDYVITGATHSTPGPAHAATTD